jgi:hypothetical protein
MGVNLQDTPPLLRRGHSREGNDSPNGMSPRLVVVVACTVAGVQRRGRMCCQKI